jgi:hypothetical protein
MKYEGGKAKLSVARVSEGHRSIFNHGGGLSALISVYT